MTVERAFEDPAAASGSDPRPESDGPEPPFPPEGPPATLDPDHPQWRRRRRRLSILFGASLAAFVGIGVAAIANMVRGQPIDPNAASVMWPLGSAAAAATGLYVWQGVRRNDWQGDRQGGRWSDWPADRRHDWRGGGR